MISLSNDPSADDPKGSPFGGAPEADAAGRPRIVTDAARRSASAFVVSGGEKGSVLEGSGLYALLVESVRDYAIFALDPTGHILSWNAGAQHIKGYRAHEIIGKHFSIFYPPEDVAAGKLEMELRVATAEGRFEDLGWRVRKDGTRFWANVVITALRDSTGQLVGFAKVTRDLTERREAEEALRRAEARAHEDARRAAAAEAASKVKSEFLAMLSHELRTPLNAIGGYTELLSVGVAGPVSDQQRDYLARIKRGQEHLLGLINDLLNYSRIEGGHVTYELARTELHPLVDGAIALVLPQAVTKEITLDHGPCDRELCAHTDGAKVEQILLNLMGNAVKFTPDGGRVSVSCTVVNGRPAIQVRDTGPGVPAEQSESIFEPFVQLGRTLTAPAEGTGLGLAISRDLARAMGGNLYVTETPGGGATFTLELRPIAEHSDEDREVGHT